MQLCPPNGLFWYFIIAFVLRKSVLCEFKGPCETNRLCLCSETRYSCFLVPLMSMPLWGNWALEGKHLDLTEAPFQVLTESSLDGLHLWTLTIAHTHLHTIENGALTSVANTMYSLDFRKNSIESFPYKQLGILKKLGALYIDDNMIVALTDVADDEPEWGNLKFTLTSLSLSGNSLTHISDHSLSQLISLRELNLARNRIQFISMKAFPSNLMFLQLDDNLLLEIPCISHSVIKILHVAKNLLKNGTCLDNVNLHLIELSSNNINSFNKKSEGLVLCAKNIKMDFNLMKRIPHFKIKCSIEKLSLKHNKIDLIEEEAMHILKNLKSLSLDYNKLRYLPKSVKQMEHLKVLHLSYNNFDEAPILPKNIRYLSLAGNGLRVIPTEQLNETSAIVSIDLSYNLIDHIEGEDFYGWAESVLEINLKGNQITHISANMFKHTKYLNKLLLNFNAIGFVASSNYSFLITDIELSNNFIGANISFLKHPAFITLLSLTLDNNGLSQFYFYDIQNTPKLKYLNLNFNRIKTVVTLSNTTFSNLSIEVLLISFNYLASIKEIPFQHLVDLRECDLSYNLIKSIGFQTLIGLKKLDSTSLDHNHIAIIERSSFVNLDRLRLLSLKNNHLKMFSFDWFENVSMTVPEGLSINATMNQIEKITGQTSSKIGNIDLSKNKLTNIFDGTFSSVGKYLLELNLAFNSIRELEVLSFTGLIVLQKLDLSHNLINSVKSKSFNELINLQSLTMSHNHISFFSSEVFWNQKHLRYLNLENNTLTNLNSDIFKNTMIECLSLARNEIEFYPATAFLHIGFTLKHVDLSYNVIDVLDQNMFFNTPFIQILLIKGNKIRFLHPHTFSDLPTLQTLDLSENLLNVNIEELFKYAVSLKQLKIENMSISKVPNLPLTNLSVLRLSFNNILALESNDLRFTRNLKKLYLDNNKIKYIHDRFFLNLKKLLYLDLSNNGLFSLESYHFRYLQQLIWLDMKGLHSSSSFKCLTFAPLKSLKTLHMDCCIKYNESVQTLNGLSELNMHITSETLKDQLKGFHAPKLTTLKISGRKLKRISNDAFENMNIDQLYLSISHTSITKLPNNLLNNLKDVSSLSLDISNNKLESMEPEVLYQNKTVWQCRGTKLLMNGFSSKNSSIKCDCNVWWLAAWLKRWYQESDSGRSKEKLYDVTCLDVNSSEIPLVIAAHNLLYSDCDLRPFNGASSNRNSFFHYTSFFMTYFVNFKMYLPCKSVFIW